MPGNHANPADFIEGSNRLNNRVEFVWLGTDLDDDVDRKTNLRAIGKHANRDDFLLNEPLNPSRHRGTRNPERGGNLARGLPAIVLQLRNDLEVEFVQIEPVRRRRLPPHALSASGHGYLDTWTIRPEITHQ